MVVVVLTHVDPPVLGELVLNSVVLHYRLAADVTCTCHVMSLGGASRVLHRQVPVEDMDAIVNKLAEEAR